MKAAIIGTGFIAHSHAGAIKALGHELAAVVSATTSEAKAFAEQYGCSFYTDQLTEELLSKVDTVHICTPPECHFEQVSKCLRAGKHVLCEKPLSLSAKEAQELAELAEKAEIAEMSKTEGTVEKSYSNVKNNVCQTMDDAVDNENKKVTTGKLVTAVNFNNRFYDSVNIMRKQIMTEGPVIMGHGLYCQEFHMLPCPWSWRYTEKYRAVSEIGSHFIDLLRFTTGQEVRRVSALFVNHSPDRIVDENGMMHPEDQSKDIVGKNPKNIHVKNEDGAVITFELENGAPVSCFLCEIAPGRSNDLQIELMTPKGSFSWGAEHPYQVVTGRQSQGMITQSNAFGGGFGDSFASCFKAFYQAVETGERDERLASFKDAAINARIVEAIGESAEKQGSFVVVCTR